jgi:xanthine dehydrogenase YagR molybdenum-binding subunit
MSIIQKAVQTIAPYLPAKAPDPLIGSANILGKGIPRVDGALKVTGQAQFAAEVPFENLTFAAFTFSTIARGRITAIDVAEAERAPGVVFVMTHLNAPRMAPPPQMMIDQQGAAMSKLPVMQDASIHWNGEPVALVLAETQEQADHAASLIRATYHIDTAALKFDEAKVGAHLPKDVLGEPAEISIGDAEAALEDAAFTVDAIYHTPRHNHAAIEMHAATIVWQGDQLQLHDATQMLNNTQYTLAKVFAIDKDKICVMSPFVGGAFGNKAVWSHHILAIAAAKISQRPVRVVLTRAGVFRTTGGRTTTEQRVALGSKSDGTLAALIHTGVAAMSPNNLWPEQFTFPARHLYSAETFFIEQKVVELDMLANTAMRAPGESIGTFALESALDELAVAMALDPIELRRRMEPSKDPTNGLEFSSRHLTEAYQRGAARFGWAKRNPVPRSTRDGDWLIGLGVATAFYPYYRMPGAAARIRLTADGRAVASMASHEMGMGTATVQAQHLAERLGLPVDHVRFEYGDTRMPAGTIAGGSSQTATIVAAVTAAADVLVKDLLKLAGNDSVLAGLKQSDVEARNGGLCASADPTRCETYTSILRRAGRDEVVSEAQASMPLETMQYSMFSYGAQFCEVRVNDLTGETRVSRWLGSFDTGRILNSKTAASQFKGGIIMGLGLALTEETLFDERTGRIMNPSLAEYHIPVHMDVPEIDVMWTDIPDPHTPLGLHGIGEIGITGVGAAVANAIYNATGKRVRSLPITLDKIMTTETS